MIRNLKALGLSLVAIFALSAMVASAASANQIVSTPYWFASDGDWTTLSGSQGTPGDVFETDAGLPIKCTTTNYSGSVSVTTTTTITLTPSYANCTFGGFTADVVTNGCRYEFHADGKTGTTTTDPPADTIHWENKYHTETTIKCDPGKDITVTATQAGVVKCTVHIGEQNLPTGIVLTNETKTGGVKDIKAHINFTTIKYSQTEGSGLGKCATADNTNNGKYTGSATISGKNTANVDTSVWMEPFTD